MAPWIRTDLALSRAQLGVLMSCFFLFAGAGSISAGTWADAVGARRTTCTGLLFGSVAVAVGAHASTPLALGAASAAAGLSFAAVNAGTSVAIAVGVSPRLRTVAVSARFAGVCTASAIAGLASPPLARSAGWRPVMYVYCALAVAAAAIAYSSMPGAQPRRMKEPSAPDGSLLLLALGIFIFIAGANPLLTWSVSFLIEDLAVSAFSAGVISATSTVVGGLVMLTVSWWHVRRPLVSAARMVPLVATLCLASLLLLAAASAWPSLAFAVMGVVAGVAMNFLTVNLAITAVIQNDPHAAGRSTGIITTGQFLGGAAAPTAFGALVDAVGGRYPTAWLVSAALIAVSVGIFWRWESTTRDR
jgi:predicted MFS family arabinose efflux permease